MIKQKEKNRQVLKTAFPGYSGIFIQITFVVISQHRPDLHYGLHCLLLKEQRVPIWMHGIKFPLKNIFIHQRDGFTS